MIDEEQVTMVLDLCKSAIESRKARVRRLDAESLGIMRFELYGLAQCEFCPITLACYVKCGVYLDTGDVVTAASKLHIDNRTMYAIVASADYRADRVVSIQRRMEEYFGVKFLSKFSLADQMELPL